MCVINIKCHLLDEVSMFLAKKKTLILDEIQYLKEQEVPNYMKLRISIILCLISQSYPCF